MFTNLLVLYVKFSHCYLMYTLIHNINALYKFIQYLNNNTSILRVEVDLLEIEKEDPFSVKNDVFNTR